MNDVPLINGIKKYIDEKIVPFSMPGHKMGRAFEEISELLLKGDLTEVEGLDNLHKPEGIIKEAEEKLANLYNSKKSYMLVNGSTCGNLIMIFSSFDEGDKILVERNCHRSIMNGILLRKLEPIFVRNIFNNKLKAPIGIDIKHLEELLDEHKDIKGIVLTYPNYYGIGIGLDYIIYLCKRKGLKVLIDSAHGAHYGFNTKLPRSAYRNNVDMVVMSAHKTLPSLTQTSWLHVNKDVDLENVEFYKGIFMSTSPSYMFMMSLDYSRAFLENGQEEYNNLFNYIDEFKEDIRNLKWLKIIENSDFINDINIDLKDDNRYINSVELDCSRIVINLEYGLSGNKLLDYLRNNKIQCEMSDHKNVVLIPSPFNTKEDFDLLTKALLECNKEILKDTELDFYINDIPTRAILPYEIISKQKVYVDIEESLGCIVAENIVPYPPGVPLLIVGEVIEYKHIEAIKNFIDKGITIIGINDRKIKIIKN